MAINAKLTISASDPDLRIGGFDSMIVGAQDEDLSSLGFGQAAFMDSNVLTPKLLSMSHLAALRLGERLHHADWWLTDNIDLINELSLMHDCQECRDGAERAVAFVKATGRAVLVGQLYWIHPEDGL